MDAELHLYDLVMIGQKETCGKELFESTMNGRKEYNPVDEARALKIIRYAFEYYLGWTPEQVHANIDPAILKRLKVDSMVRQRIKFPVELEPMESLQYLVHKLYPDRYYYDENRAVEDYYERILSGEITRFKKGFFARGDEGSRRRAEICFRRMLQMIGPFTDVHQLYDLFSSTKGNKLLGKFKLGSAVRDLYDIPITFLHQSLPVSERDDLYYHKNHFRLKNEKTKKEMKKAGIFIA